MLAVEVTCIDGWRRHWRERCRVQFRWWRDTFTIVVYWTSVTSHSMFESGGDRLTADQVIPVLTNVAMPWCLLGIDPARTNPDSFRLSSVVLCVSCSRTTATWLESASCRMTSSLAFVRPSALSWNTDIPWFSTVGMTARPEEGASLYLGLSVRWSCGDISFESSVLRISRGGRVEAAVISSR